MPDRMVIIASDKYLLRLGIKTMISVVGMDPQIKEVDGFNELVELASEFKGSFVIFERDFVPEPFDENYELLVSGYNNSRIMCIADSERDFGNNAILIETDTQKKIFNKFYNFFNEPFSENGDKTEDVLSQREYDVLQKVAMGYSNKEIAEQLFISINTVICHRKNITNKLGIKTISGLTVYAILNGIIKPDEVVKQ